VLNEIKWTYHALKEVKEELRTDNDEYAKLFIKDCMRQATFISEIMGENGKIDRLFAYRRYCFVLDRTDDVVITAYKRENVHEEIRTLVQELLFDKLADIERDEEMLEKERLGAEMAVEIHREINKALNRGRESSAADLIRVAEAKAELDGIERKLYEFRLKKSKLAKGIAAYL
jgi:hypothetical protein